MNINLNSIIAISLISVLYISCELDKENSNLPIPDYSIEKIVIGLNPDEVSITDKPTINEAVQILKKAYKHELETLNSSDEGIVRIQLVTSNSKNGQIYLLDKVNGSIKILSMKKTPVFKIDDIKKMNNLLRTNSFN